MNSGNDMPILLNRKVIDKNTFQSRIKIGKDIVNIKSTFNGDKKYSDLLFELACRKLSA